MYVYVQTFPVPVHSLLFHPLAVNAEHTELGGWSPCPLTELLLCPPLSVCVYVTQLGAEAGLMSSAVKLLVAMLLLR